MEQQAKSTQKSDEDIAMHSDLNAPKAQANKCKSKESGIYNVIGGSFLIILGLVWFLVAISEKSMLQEQMEENKLGSPPGMIQQNYNIKPTENAQPGSHSSNQVIYAILMITIGIGSLYKGIANKGKAEDKTPKEDDLSNSC
jgi:hypothetical protein